MKCCEAAFNNEMRFRFPTWTPFTLHKDVLKSMKKTDDLIIDFHLHVGSKEMHKPFVWNWMDSFIQKGSGLDRVMDPQGELNPAALSLLLEENEVDYGVCLAEYSPISTGMTTNEYVSDFCKDFLRLIPFANINPYLVTRPEDELLYCLDELGMCGLKLLPSYQHFYPHDRRLYPMYHLAQERDIVVMSHTGSSIFPGTKIRYADPVFWDDIAVDFPSLKILLVHSGRGFWYDKAAFLAQLHQNVYLEIAGLPPQNLMKYIPELDKLSSKTIFGTDWPAVSSIKNNIEIVRSLPISEASKKKILGLNAAKLLKIKDKP